MKNLVLFICIGSGLWIITILWQLFVYSPFPETYSLLGGNCLVTGYPFAECIDAANHLEILMYSLLNISFWCLVVPIIFLMYSYLFNRD